MPSDYTIGFAGLDTETEVASLPVSGALPDCVRQRDERGRPVSSR